MIWNFKVPQLHCVHKMKGRMKRHIALAMLISSTLLVGCNGRQPPTGRKVTVQLNRNALGTGDVFVPLTTDSINGMDVSIKGTLSVVTADWIMLETGDKDHWIPRHNVLLIRIDD